MSARGQKFTVKWKTPIYYSDFVDTFTTNPTTGALATVTNEQSIEQSIKNIVLTSPGSRPGRNAFGSKVMSSLFGLGTPQTLDLLETSIRDAITSYEPRAQNVVVRVDPSTLPNDAVVVNVTFQPENLPQPVNFSFPLPRVR